MNSNGKHLAEFAFLNDLFLTNTKFNTRCVIEQPGQDQKGEMN